MFQYNPKSAGKSCIHCQHHCSVHTGKLTGVFTPAVKSLCVLADCAAKKTECIRVLVDID